MDEIKLAFLVLHNITWWIRAILRNCCSGYTGIFLYILYVYIWYSFVDPITVARNSSIKNIARPMKALVHQETLVWSERENVSQSGPAGATFDHCTVVCVLVPASILDHKINSEFLGDWTIAAVA